MYGYTTPAERSQVGLRKKKVAPGAYKTGENQ